MLALIELPLFEQAQEIVSSQTVWEFLQSGGPIMVPIALCSVVALAFAMERMIFLRRTNVAPAAVTEAVEMLHAGRTDDAVARTKDVDAPAVRILAAGLRREGMPLEHIEHEHG